MAKKKKKKKSKDEEVEEKILRTPLKETMSAMLKEGFDESKEVVGEAAAAVWKKISDWFWRIALGLFLLALVLILAPRVYDALKPTDQPLRPVALEPGVMIDRSFRLLNGDNKWVSEAGFATRAWAVMFGYTHCGAPCAKRLERIGRVWSRMNRPDRFQAFFICLDPDRDAPDAIKYFMQPFDSRIVALTGPPVLLNAVKRRFKAYGFKVGEPDEADYRMDYTATIFLLRSDGLYVGDLLMDEPEDVWVERLNRLTGG